MRLWGGRRVRPAERQLPQDAAPRVGKEVAAVILLCEERQPGNDCINMPAFSNETTAVKLHWGYDPKQLNEEINAMCSRLQQIIDAESLVATDFIATFVHRRVQPLQRRSHRIYDMSGRRDPCCLSTIKL